MATDQKRERLRHPEDREWNALVVVARELKFYTVHPFLQRYIQEQCIITILGKYILQSTLTTVLFTNDIMRCMLSLVSRAEDVLRHCLKKKFESSDTYLE